MTHTAIASVFTIGDSQIICLPQAFRLEATEVVIVRADDSLIVTPCMTTWAGFAEGLSGCGDGFTVTDCVTADADRDEFV